MQFDFDDIVDNVKNLVNIAGKKTTEIVDLSKMKLEAINLNSEIRKCFEKLGALVYTAKKNGSIDEAAGLDSYFDEIDALYLKLKELNDRIDGTKDLLRCSVCGSANPRSSVYCSVCGSKLPTEAAVEKTEE